MTAQQLLSSEVLEQSDVAFGTSGARGLVTDFSADVCAAFTHAFVAVMRREFEFSDVAIAIDNRPSSVAMAQACAAALTQVGLGVRYYGVIPTPALAVQAMQDHQPCIMVTGSHIPFDRNGLKFYRPDGEISKADEQAILSESAVFASLSSSSLPELEVNKLAAENYIQRYTSIFDAEIFSDKKIGIYEHSSAGRDLYAKIFSALGAEVTTLERTETFVPIDTEAVCEEDRKKARNWSNAYGFDAIISTDGDGDRPLIADENGEWLRGDILGLLCADALNIEALAVPVSCNTAIEKSGAFKQVVRTKIGSPYVIAEFAELGESFSSVAGFEANGGFLLGSDVSINGSTVSALPTRDAMLPAVMLLSMSVESNISTQVKQLPQRFTASDRIKNFAREDSLALIEKGQGDPSALLALLGFVERKVEFINTTDGLRLNLDNGDVVHLRPSGNAPELRCYVESTDKALAENYVTQVLSIVKGLCLN